MKNTNVMASTYEHCGYFLHEVRGSIVSVRKDGLTVSQCDHVECKGTDLVPAGARGIVIALRKPMTNPVGEHFVMVAFREINQVNHIKLEDITVL